MFGWITLLAINGMVESNRKVMYNAIAIAFKECDRFELDRAVLGLELVIPALSLFRFDFTVDRIFITFFLGFTLIL